MHKAFKPGEQDGSYNFEEHCPMCGNAIPILLDDNDTTTYAVNCPVCGYRMKLCTLCRWDQEEENDWDGTLKCDWNYKDGCFRERLFPKT